MKEFITDLLQKVNNSIDKKINNTLVRGKAFANINQGHTYTISNDLCPIYADFTIDNRTRPIIKFPSWCKPVENLDITLNVDGFTTFHLDKGLRIEREGFYLIEYEIPQIQNVTLPTTQSYINIYSGQIHYDPQSSKQAYGLLGIHNNSTDKVKVFSDFLQSRKREIFYFHKGSILGGMFFICIDNSTNNFVSTTFQTQYWVQDYSYAKITPVDYVSLTI